ncbi:MAG TPA: hypothetical protein VGL18_04665 [Actinomycetota bacterium]
MISIEVGLIPLIFILLLFPHGRLLSRRWRVVAWAAVAIPLVGGTATAISDVNFSTPSNFPMLRDPVQLLPSSVISPIYSGYQIASLVLLLQAASLVLRFRNSRGEERQQLKWIAFAGLAAAVGFIVLAPGLGPEPVLAFIVLFPLIAVAAGIAILKYRPGGPPRPGQGDLPAAPLPLRCKTREPGLPPRSVAMAPGCRAWPTDCRPWVASSMSSRHQGAGRPCEGRFRSALSEATLVSSTPR